MLKLIPIQKRLQQAHSGYAYQLLQLQMAVQDQKLGNHPSITQITRLIQLYMIGVEVLESIADPRFVYFHNKIHALMLKKHIVKKLHEASGDSMKQSIKVASKAQLKDKKDEYQINFFFNQGQVDIKKVQQMLTIAQNKQIQVEGKIKTDIKKQQQRLEQRIKIRKMRSQAGSVIKYNLNSQKQIDSPNVNKKQQIKDPRMQYFELPQKFIDILPKNKGIRTNSGSLQKMFIERKYISKKIPGSADKQDNQDAI